MATALVAPSSFSDMDDQYIWRSGFDFSHMHPSHGVAHDGGFIAPSTTQDDMSAAEKLLAALAASSSEDEGDMILDASEAGDSSDSSLDTPSTSFSLASELDNCFKNGESGTEFSYFSNPSYSASAAGLERVSSCYFTPPSASILEASLAPLDSSLQAQLSSDSYQPVQSYSLAPSASTSSGMMRSFSAPAHTQAEYDLLRAKWNEEAAAASTSSLPTPELGMARTNSQQPPSPVRPGMPRRATSGSVVYSSRKGKSRQSASASAASAEDAASRSYSDAEEPLSVQNTFSSRTHLLSPTKQRSPFKRSRLSYSTAYHTAIYEDPREDELATPPRSSSFSTVQDCNTTPTKSSTPSRPKSPTRPGYNRHFTSPEFSWQGIPAETASE